MNMPITLPRTLPPTVRHYSTSPVFTEITVPEKLTSLHRTKPGVWGRLVIEQGTLRFIEPGPPERDIAVSEGEEIIIAPEVPHRVAIAGPVRFLIEFHRE